MDICIFYFSGTGNTKWIVDTFVEDFSYKGMEAEAYSIEMLDTERTEELAAVSRILMFAYPIYGSYMPRPMKEFIDALPQAKLHREVAVVCTQMIFSGDGAWFYHEKFEEKGYTVNWAYHFRMPNNISARVSPLPYTTDPVKIKKILSKNEERIKDAVDNINMNVPKLHGSSGFSHFLGLMQRPYFKKLFDKPLKSPFSVDSEECVECMRCIQLCPMSNIRMKDDRIVFGTECTLCMRCYNYCPKTALSAYGVKHRKGKPTYKGPEGFDPASITPKKNLRNFID